MVLQDRAPRAGARVPALLLVMGAAAATIAVPGLSVLDSPTAPAWGLLVTAGLVAGFLSGMLGIGGALITAPALYAALPLLGVPAASLPQAVVAAALMAMIPTTLAVAGSHARRGAIDRLSLRRLAVPMAIGAVIGGLLSLTLQGPVIPILFATQALCYGSWLMLYPARDEAGAAGRWIAGRSPWSTASVVAGFCACVGMGATSLVALYLRCRGLALKPAVATGNALNLCIAAGGVATFAVVSLLGAAPPLALSALAAIVVATFAMLAAPTGVAAAHRLPNRSFGILVGAVNVAGAVALIGHVVARPVPTPPIASTPSATAVGAAAPAARAVRAADLAFDGPTPWRRFALHALLVPLLESDGPPAWTVPHEMLPCSDGMQASVDGRPFPYGRPLAERSVVAFRLQDCWPMDMGWLGLSGTVEMTVLRQRHQLVVWVQPLQLEASMGGRRMAITEAFSGSVAFGSSEGR